MRKIQETGDKGKGATQDRERQFGDCTQDEDRHGRVVVGGQCTTIFRDVLLQFSFLFVPYSPPGLCPFSFFRYSPKRQHNSGQQLNRVATLQIMVWREKPGQHWALLMTSRDRSAILYNTEGQTQAKATHLHLWLT